MKPLKYTMAVLALIAAASFTSSAKAASTGDLIFGAYDTNDTGLASYELDLGSFSTLDNGETWNLGSTVTSLYSSDSSSAIVWNIAAAGGGTGGGNLAKKEVATTAESLPTNPAGNTTESGNISSETSNFSNGTTILLPSSTSSTGTGISAVSVANNSGNSSFYDEFNSGGTGGYGYGAGLSDTFPSTDNVTLYTIPNTTASQSGTADGTFSLSNVSGNEILTYEAPAAVPEPSAYALGLCAVALFWVLKRRNSVA